MTTNVDTTLEVALRGKELIHSFAILLNSYRLEGVTYQREDYSSRRAHFTVYGPSTILSAIRKVVEEASDNEVKTYGFTYTKAEYPAFKAFVEDAFGQQVKVNKPGLFSRKGVVYTHEGASLPQVHAPHE